MLCKLRTAGISWRFWDSSSGLEKADLLYIIKLGEFISMLFLSLLLPENTGEEEKREKQSDIKRPGCPTEYQGL